MAFSVFRFGSVAMSALLSVPELAVVTQVSTRHWRLAGWLALFSQASVELNGVEYDFKPTEVEDRPLKADVSSGACGSPVRGPRDGGGLGG